MKTYNIFFTDCKGSNHVFRSKNEPNFVGDGDLGVPLIMVDGVDGRRHYVNINNIVLFTIQEVGSDDETK